MPTCKDNPRYRKMKGADLISHKSGDMATPRPTRLISVQKEGHLKIFYRVSKIWKI